MDAPDGLALSTWGRKHGGRGRDHARLRQALANVVDNAVKYTPGGGEITLSATGDAGDVTFEVRDTGPGIPMEQQARIWERLYRGDAGRTERGLGLGLSLVKAIVEAHGGRAEVTSEPGRGSAFRLVFPASGSSAAATPTRA